MRMRLSLRTVSQFNKSVRVLLMSALMSKNLASSAVVGGSLRSIADGSTGLSSGMGDIESDREFPLRRDVAGFGRLYAGGDIGEKDEPGRIGDELVELVSEDDMFGEASRNDGEGDIVSSVTTVVAGYRVSWSLVREIATSAALLGMHWQITLQHHSLRQGRGSAKS